MNIIAFGASYSKDSINKQFAENAARYFPEAHVEVLDLTEYPLPLFTVDIEKEIGIPENAIRFYHKLQSADLIIISLAEHNGSYTAAFKNLFDWVSRHQPKMFDGKKVLLVSTAPGPRGGLGVMGAARTRFPIHGAEIVGNFSLPKFSENFDTLNGITEPTLKEQFETVIASVLDKISEPVLHN